MKGISVLLFLPGKKITGLLLGFCFLVTGGCISATIGDVRYEENQISVAVENPSPASEATLQVTILRIFNLQQQEIATVWNTTTINKGSTTIILPCQLDRGTYKLYVYLLENGERKTAVIRDIVV
jgi:hypothetical protein